MRRGLFRACNALAVTTLIGCAADDSSTAEEDAVADAAAAGQHRLPLTVGICTAAC